jgi:hypothetical protein
VALAILTGYDKEFGTWLLNFEFFQFANNLELDILKNYEK